MDDLGIFIDPQIFEDALSALVLALLFSGTAFLFRRARIWLLGGRRTRRLRVLNKSRADGSYKKRAIAKRLLYLALSLPGMLSRDRVLFAVPLVAGIALSIADTIREKETESAIEYEHGLLYRGRFTRWKDITLLNENLDYEELRLREETLYCYKEDQSSDSP